MCVINAYYVYVSIEEYSQHADGLLVYVYLPVVGEYFAIKLGRNVPVSWSAPLRLVNIQTLSDVLINTFLLCMFCHLDLQCYTNYYVHLPSLRELSEFDNRRPTRPRYQPCIDVKEV